MEHEKNEMIFLTKLKGFFEKLLNSASFATILPTL